MKILAAIVTYNRSALLERCLDALQGQSRAPDALLVINNSSTDDTVAMLERRGVAYVTQPNLGSAGGWRRAIDEALAQGVDAVWLMDDDGYPHAQALGLLEENLDEGVACMSSVVLREDDRDRFVFPFPLLDEDHNPVLIAAKRKVGTLAELRRIAGGPTYPYAHLFNGALVRIDAVRAIGNVDDGFFLMGDELDFFMRMRRFGPVKSLLAAWHLHPDVSRRPLNEAKFYYYVKNTMILNRRYFGRLWLRDAMAVAAALGRTARRNSLGEALSYVVGKRAPLLWKAIARGAAGKVGKDLDD